MFSRLPRPFLTLAGVALVAAGGYLWWAGRKKPALSSPRLVALLPAENQSGRPELAWTESLLVYSLVRQFEGAPNLTLIPAASRAEAAAAGAGNQLECNVAAHGGQAEVRCLLYGPPPGQILGEGSAAAPLGDPPALLTALGRNLATLLGAPGAARPPAFHSPAVAFDLAAALTNPTEAPARLKAASIADPACGWCWLAWAEAEARAGGAPAAQAVLDRVRPSLNLFDPVSRARLALLDAGLKGDSAARLAALDRLAAVLPSDGALQRELADNLVAVRQYARAQQAYRRAIALQPAHAENWNSLAYALAYEGKFAEARQALDRYSALEPASPNPLDSTGEVQIMAGEFPQAAKTLVQAYERDKNFNDGAALEKAALAHYLAGERDAAAPVLERYLTDRDKAGDPLAALSRARWECLAGRTAEGRAHIAALAGDTGSPVAPIAASMLALRLAAEGDQAGAIRAAASARALARNPGQGFIASFVSAALSPDTASALSDPAARAEALALGLTLRGDWAAAAEAWKRALLLARGGSDAPQRELLALCLVSAGRASEAAGLVTAWPVLSRDQALLYDFLIYPDLLFVRAEVARAAGRASDAQRFHDLFLQHAGDRPDRFGRLARARAASRL